MFTLASSSGCFFWYSSIAACVSARSPAGSLMLSVTGLFGSGGTCASAAGSGANAITAAATAVRKTVRRMRHLYGRFIVSSLLA
jgi:hypothetical protein